MFRHFINVAHPWNRVFRVGTSTDAIHLVSLLLVYPPKQRPSALAACAHVLFDELRQPDCKLPNGRPIPCCTDFTAAELSREPGLAQTLVPSGHPVDTMKDSDTVSATGSEHTEPISELRDQPKSRSSSGTPSKMQTAPSDV
ncbi:hypothetical protein AB6A40_008702 [Gnathostoma spinigerum]|uniref:Uncharacterized protein n=1 Tax=Gnathostoma spinigerum TaxID=75299 RepID=A0ABD6EQ53_9BILA